MYLTPDNFFYFIILFLVSIFSGTYLMFAYYKDRLLALNTLTFFLCAYRIAFEYYLTTISNFQDVHTFVTWQGYGVLINLLIASQWICMWFYIRPLKNWKWERLSNNVYLWFIVIIPFTFHSWFMARGNIFQYNPEKIDGYWQFTMITDNWYYPIYSIHTKIAFLIIVITLFVGVIRNKNSRLKQSILFLSYLIVPYIYFSINVPSLWNIPNNGILHISQTIVLSWYLSNYRLFKSNIDLISTDLFNSISDLTISTDAKMKITSYNDQTKEMFDIKTKSFEELLKSTTNNSTLDIASTLEDLTSNVQHEIELEIQDKVGHIKTMNLKCSPFKNGDKLYGYTFLLTDLTKIRVQEKKLLDLNNIKDTLFQIIGHDLKKPTITFRNLSKNINYLLQKKDFKRLQALGNEVDQDAKSLYNLTDNLLNWALLQKDGITIRSERINIYELVQYNLDLFMSLASRKNIIIKNEVTPTLYTMSDRNSLDTIIRNLVDNAIKYTPESGEINLSAKINNGMVQITVEDNGIGMNASLIDRILKNEIIKSNKGLDGEKGSGIGLQLVQQLVKRNMGTLSISSSQLKGSIFRLNLPKAS